MKLLLYCFIRVFNSVSPFLPAAEFLEQLWVLVGQLPDQRNLVVVQVLARKVLQDMPLEFARVEPVLLFLLELQQFHVIICVFLFLFLPYHFREVFNGLFKAGLGVYVLLRVSGVLVLLKALRLVPEAVLFVVETVVLYLHLCVVDLAIFLARFIVFPLHLLSHHDLSALLGRQLLT